MQGDRLFEIFINLLGQPHDEQETAAMLIRRSAGAYVLELLKKGDIPYSLVSDVLADLEAEALEMYRKTTYGHFSLESYRETLQAKTKS